MNMNSINANALLEQGESKNQNTQSNNTSNSTSAQRSQLLVYLSKNTSITTLGARKLLDNLLSSMNVLVGEIAHG